MTDLLSEGSTDVRSGDTPREPPRENEQETWDWLNSVAIEADRVRKEEAGFDSFQRWLDMYYGQHWPEALPSFRPAVVINELRSLLLQEANDLSDAELRVYIMKDPRKGTRDEDAERAFRAVWTREQVDLKLIYGVLWSEIIGTGFMRVQFDPDAFHGLGDVVIEDVDPRYILPDPDATNDKNWQFVIIESVLDLSEVERLFPVTGVRIKPEDKYSVKDSSRGNVLSLGPLMSTPMSASGTVLGRQPHGYKKARVRVLDCRVFDPEVESGLVEVKDKNGKVALDDKGNPQLKEERTPKYPHGRRIVGANGVILLDDALPTSESDFGVLRIVLEPTLSRFWGAGLVQQTAELQLAADKLQSAVVENAIRLNNGMIVASGNTGLDFESFASIPGQIIQINASSALKIEYPPAMPSDMIQAPERMLDLQKRILGFGGARGGTQSKGNVSPELTETEISQSQGNTRLRSKLLYHTIQRLAEMIFIRMAHGYTTERSIPAVEGENFKPVEWQPIQDPEKYAVFVDPASFQILSKSMLRRLGLALYRLKAIDRKSLLKALGWPEGEAIANQMNQAEQQAAMMKLQARGHAGGRQK